MKCCIVTVYRSQNCGSFLQAYALSRVVEQFGFEPVFYKYIDKESIRVLKIAVKALAKARIHALGRICSQMKRFRKARKVFGETKEKSLPVYILGSDTIWDVKTNFFRNNTGIFFGNIFDSKNIISYAPSSGYASKEDFAKLINLTQLLDHISSISVRENSLKSILEKYTDKAISVVCDPTLLIGDDDYKKLEEQDCPECIFIYYYGKMDIHIRREVEKLSNLENLRTISFGESNTWCDIVEPYDPKRFLGYYRSAKYIVTNTFHGTVFSHIYNKRFVVIGNKKPKILDFLNKMGTVDKIANTPEAIMPILSSEYDYKDINCRIAAERENGMQFLRDSIGMY